MTATSNTPLQHLAAIPIPLGWAAPMQPIAPTLEADSKESERRSAARRNLQAQRGTPTGPGGQPAGAVDPTAPGAGEGADQANANRSAAGDAAAAPLEAVTEALTRIQAYEMAFRMQTSVPDLTDLSQEPDHVLEMYGPDVTKPGTFAASCLLARRMAERGVQCIQLFHRGWDQHGGLPKGIASQCRETDQPCAALIQDLKQRGMLEETLVIWAGEFGRTPFGQGKPDKPTGRDHFGKAFSWWLAGGGIQGGISYGETDDFAHDGQYDAYLTSAHQTDAFIRELWDWVQADENQRKGEIVLMVAGAEAAAQGVDVHSETVTVRHLLTPNLGFQFRPRNHVG